MTRATHTIIRCPECGIEFPRTSPRKVFCTPAHQQAFHNRSMAWGKVLVPLAIVARQDPRRAGVVDEVSRYAEREMRALLGDIIREARKTHRSDRTLIETKLRLGWKAADLI